MQEKKRAVAAGHVCIDITPIFPKGMREKAENILLPGKLIHVEGADIHTGGSVANTGTAMKLLGAQVRLAGKVGDDDFGKLIRENLKKWDADGDMIVSKEANTSYSVVLAIPGTDRIFIHDAGANDEFTSDDVKEELLEGVSLFHFGYPPIMKKMYENNGEELVKLFGRVKAAGAAVSLDMAAIDPASPAGAADWKRILERTLPLVDFFVPSVEELCFMLDRELYETWSRRAVGGDMTDAVTWEEVRGLGQRCLELGAKVVLIKCGAPGIYYCTKPREELERLCTDQGLSSEAWGGKEGFEESYEPEALLSGTGAGDTSIAAFLTAVLNGENLEMALKLAAAEGACCVAAYDALGGLKSIDEMKKKIQSGWRKQHLNPRLSRQSTKEEKA